MKDLASQLRELLAQMENAQPGEAIDFDENGVSVNMQNGCVQFEKIESFRSDLDLSLVEGQVIDETLRHWYLLQIAGRSYTDEQLEVMVKERGDGWLDGWVLASMRGSVKSCRLDPFELGGVTIPDSFSVTAGQIIEVELEDRWQNYIPSFLSYRTKVVHGDVRDAARHLRGDTITAPMQPDLMDRVKSSGEDIQALADDKGNETAAQQRYKAAARKGH